MGSSQMRINGSTARARATHTRWRWPPDSSWGYRFANDAGRPTCSSSRSTRSDRWRPSPMPWMCIGSATMLPTLWRGFRLE